MSEPDPLRTPRLFTTGFDYAEREAPPRARRRLWPWIVLALLILPVVTPPAVVLALRWLPPPTTAFMLQSPVKPVRYRWVPAAQIPEPLRRAAVASEDQKFWTHHGFDFEAIAKALEHNKTNRRVRGASTISQQVAKNLFLWPSRSYLRKGLEVSITVLLELLWPKQRILEVYLNVAEFGPGVYGAEAAAQRFFGKSAAQMSPAECAQLAAVLPNPRKWRVGNPGPYVQQRTDWILGQIGQRPRFSFFPGAEEPEPAEPEPSEPELAGDEAPAEPVGPETAPAPADDASAPAGEAPADAAEPVEPAAPQEVPAEEPATETEPAP